ncbi:MAG: hypothetical protein ACTSXU_09210 [Promethearchaeota archaeon]
MNSDENFEIPNELRKCPYCDEMIETRPYWNHIATKHPKEYENSRTTWYPLFKDYVLAGMSIDTILMVMPELFNSTPEEIENFLIHETYKDKISEGMDKEGALKEVEKLFNKPESVIKQIVKD